MSPPGEWESEAGDWLRWARTPNHDAYWFYRDAFFDHLIPGPGRHTIEVGCGEGRVTRDLLDRGHRVTGVDSAVTLVRYAQEEGPNANYVASDGAALPFPDGSFDLAVAYNSLQVVADMAGTVREASRVLERGGRFCFCVSHPTADVGKFVDQSPDAQYLVRDSYFERRRVDDRVDRDGFTMRFQGWTYSLEDYARALEEAAFRIESIREPVPRGGGDRYKRWNRLPMFLLIRAIRETT